MKSRKIINIIETNTLGQPTRSIVSGFPVIPGNTMQEKFIYMRDNMDWIRTMTCLEPRGSSTMSGALVTQPCTPGTDVGVLYLEVGGWLPMCGHDTIGVTVALIEAGMVEVTEPVTKINLDTAAGVVEVEAKVEDGSVQSVSFLNAPALVLAKDALIKTENFGDVRLDVSWGGNVYAIVPSESVGLDLYNTSSSEIVEKANEIYRCASQQLVIRHPDPKMDFVNQITHVEFFTPSRTKENAIKNCVVAIPELIDRSPCGTGTSAKCAVLAEKGLLEEGDSFIHESIIGSEFRCELTKKTEVYGHPAVYPTVTGNAYVQGMYTMLLDPDDPHGLGFQLDDILSADK